MSEVRWALLMPDGRIVEGTGQDAPGGMKLADLAEDAVHCHFVMQVNASRQTDVYLAGPANLHWTIQRVVSYGEEGKKARVPAHAKALALKAMHGDGRMFLMPDGSVGIGYSVEDVADAFRAFALARK